MPEEAEAAATAAQRKRRRCRAASKSSAGLLIFGGQLSKSLAPLRRRPVFRDGPLVLARVRAFPVHRPPPYRLVFVCVCVLTRHIEAKLEKRQQIAGANLNLVNLQKGAPAHCRRRRRRRRLCSRLKCALDYCYLFVHIIIFSGCGDQWWRLACYEFRPRFSGSEFAEKPAPQSCRRAAAR